jgi:hypothetical protein
MKLLPVGDGPPAWRELNAAEFDAIWATHAQVPKSGVPSRTLRVPDGFDSRLPAAKLLLDEFHRQLFRAFRACLPRGRKMYALDYHHPSYEFDPHALSDAVSDAGWPVTVLPEGDDTIYVADDLSFGTRAEWTPESLTFFGSTLLARLDAEPPRLLDGWPPG